MTDLDGDELELIRGVLRDEQVQRRAVERDELAYRRRVELEAVQRRMTSGELRVHLEVDHDTPHELVGVISVIGCRMLHEGAHTVRVGLGDVMPDAAPPEHLELAEGRP